MLQKSLIRKNPDYKWVIAFLCTLVLSVGLGFCSTAKNIYITPITSAFGFSRSAFTVNDSLRYITVAVATMFFSNLVEKFGTKKLMLMGMICYILFALVNAFASTLPGFYLGGILLGLAVSWTSTTMVSTIIHKWFTKNIGTILGIILASNAVGSAICISISTPLIYENGNPFGYRNAYLLTAAILIIVTILFMIFYKEKSAPTANIARPEPNTSKKRNQQHGFEFDVLLRCPEFYIITICLLLSALTTVGSFVPAHLTDIGFDPSFVASALSLQSIGLAICKPLVGILYDRFGIKTAINTCFIAGLISKLLLFIITVSPIGKALTILHCLLYALAAPLETVMISILALDLFGEKCYDKTLAVTNSLFAAGYALNSPLLNLSYDIANNYNFSFIFATIISVVIIVLMNFSIISLKRKSKEHN